MRGGGGMGASCCSASANEDKDEGEKKHEETKKVSGEEEAGKASAGDVEASGNDQRRRELAERLAHERNQDAAEDEAKKPKKLKKSEETKKVAEVTEEEAVEDHDDKKAAEDTTTTAARDNKRLSIAKKTWPVVCIVMACVLSGLIWRSTVDPSEAKSAELQGIEAVEEYVHRMVIDNRTQENYEAYIDLMEDVCFEEYLLHPFTGKDDPEWTVPDLIIANHTAVEDFIRENLLSPREMSLSALAAVAAGILSGWFASLLGKTVATTCFPMPGAGETAHVKSLALAEADPIGSRRQEGVQPSAASGSASTTASLDEVKLDTAVGGPEIAATQPHLAAEEVNAETKNPPACLAKMKATVDTIVGLLLAFVAVIGHLLAAWILCILVWEQMAQYWRILPFYHECNFLLKARTLTYHGVFPALVLGATSLFDLVLVATLSITLVGTTVVGCCKMACCFYNQCSCCWGLIACQCHKCSCQFCTVCWCPWKCCAPCCKAIWCCCCNCCPSFCEWFGGCCGDCWTAIGCCCCNCFPPCCEWFGGCCADFWGWIGGCCHFIWCDTLCGCCGWLWCCNGGCTGGACCSCQEEEVVAIVIEEGPGCCDYDTSCWCCCCRCVEGVVECCGDCWSWIFKCCGDCWSWIFDCCESFWCCPCNYCPPCCSWICDVLSCKWCCSKR